MWFITISIFFTKKQKHVSQLFILYFSNTFVHQSISHYFLNNFLIFVKNNLKTLSNCFWNISLYRYKAKNYKKTYFFMNLFKFMFPSQKMHTDLCNFNHKICTNMCVSNLRTHISLKLFSWLWIKISDLLNFYFHLIRAYF